MSEHAPDPAVPPIALALSRVAASAGTVAKDQRNIQQGFNFRGIDAVVNAVAPALREHRVIVTPSLRRIEYGTAETARGGAMTVVRVLVRYRFHGPAGDHLDVLVPAEAFDSGDKATSKAMSVAFRTALLQALALPTDEPDPDHDVYERAPERARPAAPPAAPPAPEPASPEEVDAWREAIVAAVAAEPPGSARDAALREIWQEVVAGHGDRAVVDVPDEWATAATEPTATLSNLVKVARIVKQGTP